MHFTFNDIKMGCKIPHLLAGNYYYCCSFGGWFDCDQYVSRRHGHMFLIMPSFFPISPPPLVHRRLALPIVRPATAAAATAVAASLLLLLLSL